MDSNEKMLGVESARRDLENFNLEEFEEIKRVEAAMEAGQDVDCDCYAGYTSDEAKSIANDYCSGGNDVMEAAEDLDLDGAHSEPKAGCGGCCCGCGCAHNDTLEMAEDFDAHSMEAASDIALEEDAYYRNMDIAYEAAGDADFGSHAFEQNNVQTANSIDGGMSPEEISEQMQFDRETYEEFSEDFDESNPQESGYAGITDEASADSLELAADEYFDEDKGYTSTAEYTMISDEDMGGS